MSNSQLFELRFEAEAEVKMNEHGAECVAVHPGEPCPGFPHTESEGSR